MNKQVAQRVSDPNEPKKKGRFDHLLNINFEDIVKDTIENRVIPELRNAAAGALKSAIDAIFKTDYRRESDRPYTRSYDTYYGDRHRRSSYDDYDAPRNVTSKRMIRVASESSAKAIKAELVDILNMYPNVTVAQFLQTVGETGSAVDNKWGWYSVSECRIYPSGCAWVVEMPKPEVLR